MASEVVLWSVTTQNHYGSRAKAGIRVKMIRNGLWAVELGTLLKQVSTFITEVTGSFTYDHGCRIIFSRMDRATRHEVSTQQGGAINDGRHMLSI